MNKVNSPVRFWDDSHGADYSRRFGNYFVVSQLDFFENLCSCLVIEVATWLSGLMIATFNRHRGHMLVNNIKTMFDAIENKITINMQFLFPG